MLGLVWLRAMMTLISEEYSKNLTESNERSFVVSDMERVESNAVNASDKDKECSD